MRVANPYIKYSIYGLTNSAQFTDKFRYMYSDNQRPTKTLHAICFIGYNLSKFHPPYNPLYNINIMHMKILF